jgi:hypothetical protein
MSNLDLVPAALFPSPFAGAAVVVKPEPLVGVALHHGVGTGPAKSDAAPIYIFFTAVPSHSLAVSPSATSPPPAGARGEHRCPLLLWRPAFEPRSRMSLVSLLSVCCLLPARAAAQTRRRLRAGHRAEPDALQVPLPSSPCALSCLAVVSFLCSTCVAELRFAAGTHTAEHAASSQGPAFLWPGVV